MEEPTDRDKAENVWKYRYSETPYERRVEFFIDLFQLKYPEDSVETFTNLFPETGPFKVCLSIESNSCDYGNLNIHYKIIQDDNQPFCEFDSIFASIYYLGDKKWKSAYGLLTCILRTSWTCLAEMKYKTQLFEKIHTVFRVVKRQDTELSYNLERHSINFCHSLYEDTLNTDFKLVGDDGSSVDVHKSVLAGRSPVLARMLAGEWKEAQESSLKIVGSNSTTLDLFKQYLYLVKVPEDNLEFLLELACLYEIEDMKDNVSKMICSQLTAGNATHALACARRLNVDFLKKHVNRYMFENARDIVKATFELSE